MAKVVITFEDNEEGVSMTMAFDPPVTKESQATGAQLYAAMVMRIAQENAMAPIEWE